MSRASETSDAVARLTSALERQAEELRTMRGHLGLEPQTAAQLLRPDDVAVRLSMSRAWVYRNRHVLGGFRVGGQLRFEQDALDAYIGRSRDGRTRRLAGRTTAAPRLPLRDDGAAGGKNVAARD